MKHKEDSIDGDLSKLMEFVKKVGRVFDVGRKWLYQRIEVTINECRNAFNGGTIAKDD